MKGFLNAFSVSAKELFKLRSLIIAALFIAISVIIESFTITLPFNIKINFAFIAIAAIGMICGPVMAICAAAVCDIIGYLVAPMGGFMPAYVVAAMIQGLIYGAIVYRIYYDSKEVNGYKKKELYIRLAVARILDVALVNMVINTFLNYYYGFISEKSFFAAFLIRLPKNLIELPVDLFLLAVIMPAVLTAYNAISPKSSVVRQ